VERNSMTTVADDDSTTTDTEATGEVRAVLAGAGPPREAAPDVQRRVSYVSVPPDVWALARAVAAVLGETMPPPLRIITRVVHRLGPVRARALLGQALTVEAQGGLTLPDGTRRTPGGVFFFLVRTSDEVSRADKEYIFPRRAAAVSSTAVARSTPAPAPPAPLTWTDETYRALAPQLQQDPGRIATVKITIIGRPGTTVEQGTAVALALVSQSVPDLPKGLPEPPAGTRYTVFIARRQWAKIAEALAADPEDAAIIEGYAALDPRVDGIAVYATNATTKRMQAAARAAPAATAP
jgi:hypothetical protein